MADQVEPVDELKIDLGDENQRNTPHRHEVEKQRSKGRPPKKDGTEDDYNVLHPHDVNGDNDKDSVTVKLEKAEAEANVLRKVNKKLTEELKEFQKQV